MVRPKKGRAGWANRGSDSLTPATSIPGFPHLRKVVCQAISRMSGVSKEMGEEWIRSRLRCWSPAGLQTSGPLGLLPVPWCKTELMAGKLGLILLQWLPHLDTCTALAGFLTLAFGKTLFLTSVDRQRNRSPERLNSGFGVR